MIKVEWNRAHMGELLWTFPPETLRYFCWTRRHLIRSVTRIGPITIHWPRRKPRRGEVLSNLEIGCYSGVD